MTLTAERYHVQPKGFIIAIVMMIVLCLFITDYTTKQCWWRYHAFEYGSPYCIICRLFLGRDCTIIARSDLKWIPAMTASGCISVSAQSILPISTIPAFTTQAIATPIIFLAIGGHRENSLAFGALLGNLVFRHVRWPFQRKCYWPSEGHEPNDGLIVYSRQDLSNTNPLRSSVLLEKRGGCFCI